MILEYFGEEVEWGDECGHCDNCVQRKSEADPRTLQMKAVVAPTPLKKGDRVSVPKYGRGTIEEVHDDRIAVRFGRATVRDFAPRFVRKA